LLSLLLEISLQSEEEEAGGSNESSVEGEKEGEIGVVGEDGVGAGVGRKAGVVVDEIQMRKTSGYCIMKCG
jgi:hypothetical protein